MVACWHLSLPAPLRSRLAPQADGRRERMAIARTSVEDLLELVRPDAPPDCPRLVGRVL